MTLRRSRPYWMKKKTNGFEPEYQAVLDRATSLGYTIPDSTTNNRNNLRVKYLKLEGFWNKLDLLYFFDNPSGCDDFSKINYISPSSYELFNANPSIEPTFVANTGFESDATKWFNTGYKPSTNGINLKPHADPNSNGAIIFYKGFNFSADGFFESIFGGRNANDTAQVWIAKNSNTQALTRVVSNDPAVLLDATDHNQHIYIAEGDLRSGSVSRLFINGVFDIAPTPVEGTTITNVDMYLFSANISGTATNTMRSGLSYFGLGAQLDVLATNKKEVELYEILTDTYTP